MANQHPRKERTILAVGAHPDDVEFTAGGALAQGIAEGWIAHLVVCTDGGKGSHDPEVNPAALAAQRRKEQLAAAEAVGIAEVIFLDHPDGELGRATVLTETLVRLIRRLRPDRLLSWDPWRRYQLHPDHRVAGLATPGRRVGRWQPPLLSRTARRWADCPPGRRGVPLWRRRARHLDGHHGHLGAKTGCYRLPPQPGRTDAPPGRGRTPLQR